jgi:hypothetical protein
VVDAIPLYKPVECCDVSCAIVSDDLFNFSLATEDLLKDECADCAASLNAKGMPFGPCCE